MQLSALLASRKIELETLFGYQRSRSCSYQKNIGNYSSLKNRQDILVFIALSSPDSQLQIRLLFDGLGFVCGMIYCNHVARLRKAGKSCLRYWEMFSGGLNLVRSSKSESRTKSR